MLGEVVQAAIGVGFHRVASWSPVSRAHLAVLVRKLEGIQQSERLVNRAAYRKIVHGLLSQNTIRGDDEETTQCNSCTVTLFDQDLVVLGDRLCDVCNQWVVEPSEPSLVAGSVDPM